MWSSEDHLEIRAVPLEFTRPQEDISQYTRDRALRRQNGQASLQSEPHASSMQGETQPVSVSLIPSPLTRIGFVYKWNIRLEYVTRRYLLKRSRPFSYKAAVVKTILEMNMKVKLAFDRAPEEGEFICLLHSGLLNDRSTGRERTCTGLTVCSLGYGCLSIYFDMNCLP